MNAPQEVVNLGPAREILVENKGMWNEECVTRLANKLARSCYFGDDVLLQSTLTGKGGDTLDERRLQALLDNIKRCACETMTQSDFDARIRPKVRESISNLCQQLRNLKKRRKS